MRRIAILGSTGSIGRRTLDVIDHLGGFEIQALTCYSNFTLLEEQQKKYQPKLQTQNLEEIVTSSQVDEVVIAIMGAAAIGPTLAAIRAKKRVMIATKEVLVMAGDLVMREAKKHGVELIPIDSEHSSLFSMLRDLPSAEVHKLILTASGGPFLNRSVENVTIEDALNHPRWKMGSKISIDSSTMMNKGLEVIEAHHLFSLPLDKIEVVVHPQSIIHAIVQLVDGTMLAHMGQTDMALSIQYALTHPHRKKSFLPPLNLAEIQRLEFYTPDVRKFPCLDLASEAIRKGGNMPCFMNAANEELVSRFIKGKIGWKEIGTRLGELMTQANFLSEPDLQQLIATDKTARQLAQL